VNSRAKKNPMNYKTIRKWMCRKVEMESTSSAWH